MTEDNAPEHQSNQRCSRPRVAGFVRLNRSPVDRAQSGVTRRRATGGDTPRRLRPIRPRRTTRRSRRVRWLRRVGFGCVAWLSVATVFAPSAHAVDIPNPVDWVGEKIGDFVGGGVSSVASAIADVMFTKVFEFVAGLIAAAVTKATELLVSVFDAFTVKVGDNGMLNGGLSSSLQLQMLALGAALLVLFFLIRIISALIGQQMGKVARELFFDLPFTVIGTAAAGVIGVLILRLTDEMAGALSGSFAENLGAFAGQFFTVTALVEGGLFHVLFAVFYILGAIVVGLELIVRASLLTIVFVVAPVMMATRTWEGSRRYARRFIEVSLALMFAKPAAAMALALGAAQLADGGDATSPVQMMLGTTIVLLAAFMPFALFKLIPLVESAAAVQQGIKGAPVRVAQTVAGFATAAALLSTAGGASAAAAAGSGAGSTGGGPGGGGGSGGSGSGGGGGSSGGGGGGATAGPSGGPSTTGPSGAGPTSGGSTTGGATGGGSGGASSSSTRPATGPSSTSSNASSTGSSTASGSTAGGSTGPTSTTTASSATNRTSASAPGNGGSTSTSTSTSPGSSSSASALVPYGFDDVDYEMDGVEGGGWSSEDDAWYPTAPSTPLTSTPLTSTPLTSAPTSVTPAASSVGSAGNTAPRNASPVSRPRGTASPSASPTSTSSAAPVRAAAPPRSTTPPPQVLEQPIEPTTPPASEGAHRQARGESMRGAARALQSIPTLRPEDLFGPRADDEEPTS